MNSDPEPQTPSRPGPSLTPTFVISLAITALLFAVACWLWTRLPAGTPVPAHWNAAGRVTRYRSRDFLFFLPGTVLFLTLLFRVLPLIEPRRGHLLMSSRAYKAVWLAVVLYMSGVYAITVRAIFEGPGSMAKWIAAAMGVLFIVIGNFFGKVRSNFLFGARTPWTLSSERSWNRTHRLAGWMFVIFGILLAGGALAGIPERWLMRSVVGFVVVLLATVFIYSYCVWRSDPDKIVPGGHETQV